MAKRKLSDTERCARARMPPKGSPQLKGSRGKYAILLKEKRKECKEEMEGKKPKNYEIWYEAIEGKSMLTFKLGEEFGKMDWGHETVKANSNEEALKKISTKFEDRPARVKIDGGNWEYVNGWGNRKKYLFAFKYRIADGLVSDTAGFAARDAETAIDNFNLWFVKYHPSDMSFQWVLLSEEDKALEARPQWWQSNTSRWQDRWMVPESEVFKDKDVW